jgi:quinol monooxygenase YgiN
MHAVVFHVDMKQDWEGNVDEELEQLVAMVKSVPGFVRGTWTTDGQRGLGFVVFETQQAAQGVADNAAMPPDASVIPRSVDVYEVVRDV